MIRDRRLGMSAETDYENIIKHVIYLMVAAVKTQMSLVHISKPVRVGDILLHLLCMRL